MTADYIPFSEPKQTLFQQDIIPYDPQKCPSQQIQLECSNQTHCCICGKDWGWGYWKHHHCNTVPIGDGFFILSVLIIIYTLYKHFKK